MKKINTALIKLWDNRVGAITWVDANSCAVFEFDPNFIKLGLDIAPLHMGIKEALFGQRQFHFPSISSQTFHGLPGMLADALPDKFGNSIIDTWLAREGRSSASFSPIERLCYTGKRGMGALEFEPLIANKDFNSSQTIDIAHLVELVGQVMGEHQSLKTSFDTSEKNNSEALSEILRVGTSAGGARPKAIIAMNQEGNILSGQIAAPKGYDYWLLKFDGVTDLEFGTPRGYGRIEYAYHLMAKACGIQMTECRLLEEHGRAHFMTRRFDRIDGKKYIFNRFAELPILILIWPAPTAMSKHLK
jgi:serine/threonine-protein kinase HipA